MSRTAPPSPAQRCARGGNSIRPICDGGAGAPARTANQKTLRSIIGKFRVRARRFVARGDYPRRAHKEKGGGLIGAAALAN